MDQRHAIQGAPLLTLSIWLVMDDVALFTHYSLLVARDSLQKFPSRYSSKFTHYNLPVTR